MNGLPYKLRTDAWWLGDDFAWHRPQSRISAKRLLDPPDSSVICEPDSGETWMANGHGEQYSYR